MSTVGRRHFFARFFPGTLAVAAVLLLPGAHAAHAEMTEWAVNEGGRMRLVALPPGSDGTVRGALQIEPNPGWMTYWKEPGDAGIPPQLVVSSATGATLEQLAYPVPKRIDNGSLRDIGYDHPVTLPFELAVEDTSKPVNIGVSAFVGLCRNICIPFQADFTLELASRAAAPLQEAMLLASAQTTLPETPSDDFSVTHYALTGNDLLQLKLKLPPDVTTEPQVIVTGPEGHAFFDSENGRRDGDNYALDIPIEKLPKNYDMRGKRWGILVIAGNRAMETSLVFN